MDKKDFFEKLAMFFTPEEIENLDKVACESARDVYADSPELDAESDLDNIGRWHVCECLTWWTWEEIEQITGTNIDDDRRRRFEHQLEIEW